MTTRDTRRYDDPNTTLTAEDRAAIDERLATLERIGMHGAARAIRLKFGLPDPDELTDEDDPTGRQRYWREHEAIVAKNIAQEREWGRIDAHANDRLPRYRN